MPQWMTLTQLAKLWDPSGKLAISKQVDMMWQANEILMPITWIPCNDKTKHMVMQSVGLPTVYEQMVNSGVLPSTGVDAQMFEPTAKFTSIEEIDKELADLSGDAMGLRWQRGRKHYEAHAQNAASAIFYGNTLTDPDTIPGLSFRYSDTTKLNAQNILDGGGTGATNASIWLIGFGDDACSGLYPANTMAGISHVDDDIQTIENSGGGVGGTLTLKRQQVYRDYYYWRMGIMVANWKWVVRIRRIDVVNLLAGNNDADLVQLTEDALHCLPTTSVITADPNGAARRIGWFMNRTLRKMVDRQSRKAVMAGGQLDYAVVDGVKRRTLHDIPMYTVDQLTDSEAYAS